MPTKRKDGRYVEAINVNGKRKYIYGRSPKDVKAKVRAFEATVSDLTKFGSIAEEWWEEFEPTIEFNTTKGYIPAVKRAKAHFGNEYLDRITPQDCYQFLEAFAQSHAQKTVNTQRDMLNHIFRYGVARGYVKTNPMRDLPTPKGIIPKKSIVCPDISDLEKIKASIHCTGGLLVLFAVYTGMRKQEILPLTWEDVNFAERTITVNKAVYHTNDGKPHIKSPKTKKSLGTVPILDALFDILKPIAKKKGLLFPNANGEIMKASQYDKMWESYEKETGTNFTSRQLRHYFATALIENGVPPEKAQLLLRHAQLSTTTEIYREIREQQTKKVQAEIYALNLLQ